MPVGKRFDAAGRDPIAGKRPLGDKEWTPRKVMRVADMVNEYALAAYGIRLHFQVVAPFQDTLTAMAMDVMVSKEIQRFMASVGKGRFAVVEPFAGIGAKTIATLIGGHPEVSIACAPVRSGMDEDNRRQALVPRRPVVRQGVPFPRGTARLVSLGVSRPRPRAVMPLGCGCWNEWGELETMERIEEEFDEWGRKKKRADQEGDVLNITTEYKNAIGDYEEAITGFAIRKADGYEVHTVDKNGNEVVGFRHDSAYARK